MEPQNMPNGKKLTRKRIPVSCNACRVRKLKCNRQTPCQNCVVRGDGIAASCSYAQKLPDGKGVTKKSQRADAESMRTRITRLESSILSMISGDRAESVDGEVKTRNEAHGEDHDIDGPLLSLDNRSTHWNAILNDLGAIKDAWSAESDGPESSSSNTPPLHITTHRPSLLNGLASPPDREIILLSLPPKHVSDKLIARFFDEYKPTLPTKMVLHRPTFLKQYNKHWQEPAKTKTVWIGMLFAVLCLAIQQEPSKDKGASEDLADLYRIRTAECLTLADITSPGKYMIETMILYVFIEYSRGAESDMSCWLLTGLLVRMALKLGYHRDPSQYPHLSVFDGEMRRRVFNIISQFELLFSVNIGLPKGLQLSNCDTKPPTNLYEEELYEEMTRLPSPRPLTDPTPMSYLVVKDKIVQAYACVVEFLHKVQEQPLEDLLKIDTLLIDARNAIPPHLQVRPLTEMQNDGPSEIMERYMIIIFYHKAVCLLHRKYWHVNFSKVPEDFLLHYSRKACVVSGVALLDQQVAMHQACQPGQPLESMKWYEFSLTNHDFLLAAMIIALELLTILENPKPLHKTCFFSEIDKYEKIKRSRDIWASILDQCKDAKRTVVILDGVLKRISTRLEEKKARLEKEGTSPLPPTFDANTLHYNSQLTDQINYGISFMWPFHCAEEAVHDGSFLCDGSDLNMGPNFQQFDWDQWDHQFVMQPLEY